MPHSAEQTNELKTALDDLVGTGVRVSIVPDSVTRNTFGPQMAVAGTLEARSQKGNTAYRVKHNDDNFCYFTLSNVVHINLLASVPTIMLDIPVVDYGEQS